MFFLLMSNFLTHRGTVWRHCAEWAYLAVQEDRPAKRLTEQLIERAIRFTQVAAIRRAFVQVIPPPRGPAEQADDSWMRLAAAVRSTGPVQSPPARLPE